MCSGCGRVLRHLHRSKAPSATRRVAPATPIATPIFARSERPPLGAATGPVVDIAEELEAPAVGVGTTVVVTMPVVIRLGVVVGTDEPAAEIEDVIGKSARNDELCGTGRGVEVRLGNTVATVDVD
jgi:hypothetical protein